MKIVYTGYSKCSASLVDAMNGQRVGGGGWMDGGRSAASVLGHSKVVVM